MPPRIVKALFVGSLAVIGSSLIAAVVTGDAIYLETATGGALGGVVLAFVVHAQRREAVLGVSLPSDERISDYAATTLVSLLSALVVSAIYDWRLDSIWTVPVLFFVLFLLFMALGYGFKLARARRSARSPHDAP